LWDSTKAEIAFELQHLKQLLDSFRPLLAKASTGEPDLVETAALGVVLHSFYGGAENIFKRIAQDLDKSLPAGGSWHSTLLTSMAAYHAGRPAVITPGLRARLQEYLEFRHLFRSLYGYLLKWEKMAQLVFGIEDTLRQLETELSAFLAQAGD